jgi:hypothetical protein
MMTNNDDLSRLIDNANIEVATTIEKAEKARPRRKGMGQYKPLVPLFIIVLAYVIYAAQQQEAPSSTVIAAQLSDLLYQARESVELATVDGLRPALLPNAALGAVVSYTAFPGGYFLSVQSRGVVVEMDSTGEITVSGGN